MLQDAVQSDQKCLTFPLVGGGALTLTEKQARDLFGRRLIATHVQGRLPDTSMYVFKGLVIDIVPQQFDDGDETAFVHSEREHAYVTIGGKRVDIFDPHFIKWSVVTEERETRVRIKLGCRTRRFEPLLHRK